MHYRTIDGKEEIAAVPEGSVVVDIFRNHTPVGVTANRRPHAPSQIKVLPVARHCAPLMNQLKVVLSHLTYKPDDNYIPWAEEVKKHFPGDVLIAKDLMEF